MPRELRADDATALPPKWAAMLRRGLRKHCARCGGGHLFRSWWQMYDRCPTCGVCFEREEGYFTGVMLLNLSAVLACLFVVTMGFMIALGANGDLSVWWPIGIGGVISVLLPIALYPFARTTWSAIDLAMRPLELVEIAEAEEFVDRNVRIRDLDNAGPRPTEENGDPSGTATDGVHGVGSGDADDPPGRAGPS